MAMRKRESAALGRANIRAAKLKSIDPALDVGNGNTVTDYDKKIGVVKKANDDYNTAKAAVDGQLDDLEALEKDLDAMTVNMLTGVRSKYGQDSPQYEMAGGTRKSEYKKRAVKPAAATP